MPYINKKAQARVDKVAKDLREDNTKLRKRLREMDIELKSNSFGNLTKRLNETETSLSNSKRLLSKKDRELHESTGELSEVRKERNSMTRQRNDLQDVISDYKNLGFWGRLDLAFSGRSTITAFFFH